MNLGLRWAYTSPLVEKDNRQSNFDIVTGQQRFAQDGSIEERALYKPYYMGGELYRLHRRDLQATDTTSVDGIPVTTVARTIKDCMKTGTDPYQLRAAIERAEAEARCVVGQQLSYAPHSMTAPPDRAFGRTGHRRDQTLFVAADEPAITTRSAHPSRATPGCRFR